MPSDLEPESAAGELADMLIAARRENRQIVDLSPDLVPATADAGYRVNGMVVAGLGWEPLGWKIAGTTASVRAQLGIDTPIYGRTFRQFAMTSPADLEAGSLLSPLIEGEFLVTLARDLPARDQPWTMEDVIAAVGSVSAGIEVAECRFPNSSMPPLPAVLADGSASGRYVFGTPLADWREGLSGMTVTLEVDGKVVRSGTGADVMGDPLRPLLWLAEERRRWGDGLCAGETVSTGSTTGMVPVRSARKVRAMFGARGLVEINFAS